MPASTAPLIAQPVQRPARRTHIDPEPAPGRTLPPHLLGFDCAYSTCDTVTELVVFADGVYVPLCPPHALADGLDTVPAGPVLADGSGPIIGQAVCLKCDCPDDMHGVDGLKSGYQVVCGLGCGVCSGQDD